jgi:predicted DNA-binding WGR domain protein
MRVAQTVTYGRPDLTQVPEQGVPMRIKAKRKKKMNLDRIIEIARSVRARFSQLQEGKANPYGGESIFKMKLKFTGYNPKLKGTTAKGMESDKYWEVKVKPDFTVIRKWGAVGKKAHTKAEKKGSKASAVSYAKSMAAKKMKKGYKIVNPKSGHAKPKKVYPSYK